MALLSTLDDDEIETDLLKPYPQPVEAATSSLTQASIMDGGYHPLEHVHDVIYAVMACVCVFLLKKALFPVQNWLQAATKLP
jgi:hypothetical protein